MFPSGWPAFTGNLLSFYALLLYVSLCFGFLVIGIECLAHVSAILGPGLFLLCVVVMYVLWLQVLDVVDLYVDHQRSTVCPGFQLSFTYGLSFMFAPVGIFFCLLAGLLFLLIGRTIQIHYHWCQSATRRFKAWHVWNTTYFFFILYYHIFKICILANLNLAIFCFLQNKMSLFRNLITPHML